MKKPILSILFAIIVSAGVLAQGAKRTTAFNYMREGNLDKALEFIEPTIENEKTMGDEKTWRYRGQIYSMIAGSENEEYRNLHPEPVVEAARSYLKAMQLDDKDSYRKDNMMALGVVHQQANYYGGTQFAANNFKSSYKHFKLASELAEELGVIDTVAVYNAGLAAERGEMTEEALEQYEKAIDLNYQGGTTYVLVALLHEKLGNEEAYLETVREGRVAYPTDTDLIRMELNYYLQNDKFEEAEKNLQLAIEKDPEDATLHFALGVVYDNLGKMEEAAEAYSSAIAVDANFFDALYNLGALYFNHAVELNKEANESSDNKVYEQKREEAAKLFIKAEPYLDRARAIQPDDQNTLASLRQLYAFTNQTEKYNAIKAEMEGE